MSIGMSPFYALYGYHSSFADVMFGASKGSKSLDLDPRESGYSPSSQGQYGYSTKPVEAVC